MASHFFVAKPWHFNMSRKKGMLGSQENVAKSCLVGKHGKSRKNESYESMRPPSGCPPGCLEYTFHQNSIFYKSDALLGEDLRNIIEQFPSLKNEDFHEKHNKLDIYSGSKLNV